MRNITKVIKALKEIIPDTAIHPGLDEIAGAACYHSPEMQVRDWIALSKYLVINLGWPPDCAWKQKVADAMYSSAFPPREVVE